MTTKRVKMWVKYRASNLVPGLLACFLSPGVVKSDEGGR